MGGYDTQTSATGGGYGTIGSTNYGPHDSILANKASTACPNPYRRKTDDGHQADPRVDSDLDGHAGGIGAHTSHAAHGGYGTTGSTNAGPHSSNLANEVRRHSMFIFMMVH